MEIRTLRYFLAVAKEENITRAAKNLHVTQPTLSKQIQALEDELGKKLFIRHSFSIELTEEGKLLQKRADDLVSMADKIIGEFVSLNNVTSGDIHFGLAESCQIRFLARIVKKCKEQYPGLRYHITSGDTEQVTEKLEKGLLDFAVLADTPDETKYHSLCFPEADQWGLVMPADCPLAGNPYITANDIAGLPLFCSEQGWENTISPWCGEKMKQMKLEGTFRLSYNASLFVKEHLGYLLTLNGLIDTCSENGLIFRPLFPKLEEKIYLIWKKNHVFTKIAEKFLDIAKPMFQEHSNGSPKTQPI